MSQPFGHATVNGRRCRILKDIGPTLDPRPGDVIVEFENGERLETDSTHVFITYDDYKKILIENGYKG